MREPGHAKRRKLAQVRNPATPSGTLRISPWYRWRGADKLWTEHILPELHRAPEAPWRDWYGHPLGDRDLARLLKPYGIRSKDVKIGGTVRKGYHRDQFAAAWRSYAATHLRAGVALPALPLSSTARWQTLPVRYRALPPRSAAIMPLTWEVADGSARVADAGPPLTCEVAQVAQVALPPPRKDTTMTAAATTTTTTTAGLPLIVLAGLR